MATLARKSPLRALSRRCADCCLLRMLSFVETGVVRLILHQGKELDTRRSGSDCNPYARIYLRGQAIYKTPTFKRNHNPMWEAATEFLVTAKRDAVVGIKVMDNKGFAVDPTLGYVNVKLDDILAATARQQDWFPLSGCASGRVRMSATFKPVAMAGAINSAGDFRPPIGIVRIWIKKAIDLKNVESLTGEAVRRHYSQSVKISPANKRKMLVVGGKSDPYIRVIRGGLVSARTLVFDNNLSPEFDEIVYVPVHKSVTRLAPLHNRNEGSHLLTALLAVCLRC